MALRYWRPKPRGLKRLTSSGFKFVRGRRGFSGVYHQETPKKMWVTQIFGPAKAKRGTVKDKVEEAKDNSKKEQAKFQTEIDSLPGPKKRNIKDASNNRTQFFNRQESITKDDIDNFITQHLSETTMSGAIGGFSMPFASKGDFDKDKDPAFGGRNRFAPEAIKKALRYLRITR